MNERYLFRGKRKDNGEWAYGGLDTDWGLEPEKRDRYWIIQAYLGEAFVLPETVGQCTGLKDKNGNWIFEGDIIEYKFEYGKIIYSESEAMYIAEFDTWCTDFDHIDSNRIEVIDNIHDNPELLEVSHD